METSDFLIIGAGVIGINIARELKRKYPDTKVLVLDKEKNCFTHASGRNSGVIHAGFYYSKDSLKAKFTKLGNELLTRYCEEKKLKINKCGKLVVAKDETELPLIDELLERGKNNGVLLNSISEKEAKKIEPRVRTYKRAIYSPTTSTIDPIEVMSSMRNDAGKEGIDVNFEVRYIKKKGKNTIVTSKGDYNAGYIVNAGGLYADKIALDFGFSKNYRILPFKGLYLYSNEPPGSLSTNIYPVPNLQNPFLGVHFTITVDKRIKIGPTAIPAFWREQYGLIDNFKLDEFIDVLFREASLFLFSNFDFKRLALEELTKYSKDKLVSIASSMVSGIRKENFKKWGNAGIRAQLVNIKEKKLEMDFILEGDSKSFHVLNAVSPGFTCAMPFSSYICERIGKLLS